MTFYVTTVQSGAWSFGPNTVVYSSWPLVKADVTTDGHQMLHMMNCTRDSFSHRRFCHFSNRTSLLGRPHFTPRQELLIIFRSLTVLEQNMKP